MNKEFNIDINGIKKALEQISNSIAPILNSI